MGILPIILFSLGVVFLILGWRWRNSPNEEAKTALKGLAYLKREITRVQDQVNVLQDKVQKAKQAELRETELKETEFNDAQPKGNVLTEIERKRNNIKKLYRVEDNEQREGDRGVEPPRYISPKYQEVLELSARGQRVPEIAQNLSLSQDAVLMVLKTQPKGVIR